MKFSISTDRLKEALSKVSAVVPSKTTLPILQDILFELKGNVLYLTATDLEISVKMTLDPVDGEEDGSPVAIPEDKLISVIKALPPGLLLKIETFDSDRVLITTNKGGEYWIPSEPADSFPAIPQISEENGGFKVSIYGEVLKEIIEGTVFATSKDEIRPATTGVLFQFKENEFIAVATDGYRLVKISKKGIIEKSLGESQDVIVPAKTLQIIARAIEDEDKCSILINEKHIQFSTENLVVISRLIGERYPNYESVIPWENNKELVIERDSFLSAVKRVSIFANSTTNQIKFSLNPTGQIEVSAEDIDFGGSAREVLNCTYNGEPLEIAFNAKYIVDIVKHLDGEKILFKFGNPRQPAIVKPYEIRDDTTEVLALVLPMRI